MAVLKQRVDVTKEDLMDQNIELPRIRFLQGYIMALKDVIDTEHGEVA